MFEGIGLPEIILILVILVIFFGAKRIPELAQGIGKGIREFRKSVKEIQEDPDKKEEEKKS
ncbi:MAG: twin-arginine translocase TatA/TatE family subunit [Bacteroidetes bacterium]|nr:twin-arginine translocase TatA/TatE family subunit [Bacteroidota bacterium]MCL5737869.1 twin-arginine translocase TatA/TatE family subunit [Bacteroidota bacterium]